MAQTIKEQMVWKIKHVSSIEELVAFLRWLTEHRREHKCQTVQCGWLVEAELAKGELDFVGFSFIEFSAEINDDGRIAE